VSTESDALNLEPLYSAMLQALTFNVQYAIILLPDDAPAPAAVFKMGKAVTQ
jgi:hypothetical protein